LLSAVVYIAFELGLLACTFIVAMGVWRARQRSRGWRIGCSLLVWLAAAILQATLPVIPALFFYDGVCYGFTDGRWECSFVEFAANNFSLNLVLSVFWFAVLAVMTTAGALFGAVAGSRQDRPFPPSRG
jgi:hypothetical protein